MLIIQLHSAVAAPVLPVVFWILDRGRNNDEFEICQ